MEIEKEEAYILYFLHQRNCYKVGIDETVFVNEFQIWYEENGVNCLDISKCEKIIEGLYEYKMVDIIEGRIYLKERVIGQIPAEV